MKNKARVVSIVVMTLIFVILLVYLIGNQILYRTEASWSRTKNNAMPLRYALADFFRGCNRFPSQSEGIDILKVGNTCYQPNRKLEDKNFLDGDGNKLDYTVGDSSHFRLSSSQGHFWTEKDVERILLEKKGN